MITIKELKDGERIRSQFLVTNMTKGVTTQGRNYLNVTFQDATGTIEAKKWDVAAEDLDIFVIGNIVEVDAEVIDYREHLQMKILTGLSLPSDEVDITHFVPSAPVPLKDLEAKLHSYIESIKNNDLKTLVKYLVDKFYDRYIIYPAAVRNHHNCASGLLYHSISMANIAEEMIKLYPEINRDFVIGGAIIHDLGKTLELSGPIATKYTDEGKLLGHISIMAGEIRMAADKLGIKGETPILLEHMILSHHSKPEFGSPIPPLTREAFVLASIDDFDAKMNIIMKATESVNKGEWTEKIFAMDSHAFYVPNYED